MANPTNWVKHIEAYVDSSSTPTQQVASLDAIAALLNHDILSIEALIREMGMYLTSTDNIIRARGILLLAEALTRLASKPLDDATIRSLISFFTDRLGDWKALRGALVGCLALIRRKSNVGMVTNDEAKAVAQNYLENLQVQSLGQHDRKLCFQLLECLLNRYPDAVAALGDELVYGICEAIDGEKDPQCLKITFHVVEVLAQLFPDPSGSVANFAAELFEILGTYFPIHFTHPKDEEVDAKRDDLSKALMLAFGCSPLFEPFAIPLLLEKLSSDLSSAKIDSLRYLNYCSMKYGAERMGKHAQALCLSLKDTFYNSLESYISPDSKPVDDISSFDNEIVSEALSLLQKLIVQNDNLFLNRIVADEEINSIINSIPSFKNYADISDQSRQKLHATGIILSVSARASSASCNRVFESFFLHLVEALGISESSKDNHLAEDYEFSGQFNYGALYLCIELLTASRQLAMDSLGHSSLSVSANESWSCLIQNFSHSLTEVFSHTLLAHKDKEAGDPYIRISVKGLQTLATFPGSFLFLSKSTFENILKRLMSIITLNTDKISPWTLSLQALVGIGSFVDNCKEAEKASSFMDIVILKIASLLVADESNMPLSSKLEAMFETGSTSLDFMLIITRGLEEELFSNLSEAYAHGFVESAESKVCLLECYSNKFLPWFDRLGSFEKIPLQFAINVWDQVEKSIDVNITLQQRELLDAATTAMKLAVANCCEENQTIIIKKACQVLKSSSAYPSQNLLSDSSQAKLEEYSNSFTCRDQWIISLFTSVLIALRPQTSIPDLKVILNMLMAITVQGHVAAAQALGSITNKLPLRIKTTDTSDCCNLEEALDTIFSSSIWTSTEASHLIGGRDDDVEIGVGDLKLSNSNGRLLKIHTIAGLAWMGKGLLMRGHEKVKDITMTLWSYLLPKNDNQNSSLRYSPLEEKREQHELTLMKSAADAFRIFMSETDSCLNRRFHATIKPLYKQRFFSTMVPILQSSVMKSDSLITRTMLYQAFAHIISETPLSAVSSEAKKLIPLLLDSLSLLKEDISNKDITYSLLLVLSGLLTEKNGQEAVVEAAHGIAGRLIELVPYPHAMVVRETAIQCLVAMAVLPHARIYPMRTQVLRAVSKALDDPKRAVRQEAVRCRQAWASIASRSIHF